MKALSIPKSTEFIGLNTVKDPRTLPPEYLTVANDVIVESGSVEARPGRNELAEAQIYTKQIVGIQYYNIPNNGGRSSIIVRPDGIFQRVD